MYIYKVAKWSMPTGSSTKKTSATNHDEFCGLKPYKHTADIWDASLINNFLTA